MIMAAVEFSLDDLDVLARAVLFGPRETRIDVVNAVRAANGDDAIPYVVNMRFDDDLDNAAAGSVTAETGELVVLFTSLVVSGRAPRLDVLNRIRVANGDEEVPYLVNHLQPTRAELDAAIANIE
jgi:hypothetical protein